MEYIDKVQKILADNDTQRLKKAETGKYQEVETKSRNIKKNRSEEKIQKKALM